MSRLSGLWVSGVLVALSAQAAEPASAVAVVPLDAAPATASGVAPAWEPVSPPLALDNSVGNPDRQQLATKKLALLRDTVKATKPEKSFFSGLLFSSSIRPVDSELLAEMNRYLERFADLPDTGEIYRLKAQVHQRIENYPGAALDWLALLAAYPESPFAAEARKGLQDLADDRLKKQAVAIRAVQDKLAALGGRREQRVAGLLETLDAWRDADFAAAIAAECTAFLLRTPDYAEADRIVSTLAHQQMLLDNDTAIYYFKELLALYPDSKLRPDSLLALGNIEHNGLKRYADAAGSYNALIAQYPDSPEAKQGYEALAGMYDEDMRDYNLALKTYDAIVARYQGDPLALRSLQAQARIYQEKTHQPLQAIATYRKLADTFKGKDGLAALAQAEKLARYTVGDWKLSIEINQRIAADYPDSDEAPQALFANAGIYQDKLKDRAQALKLYQEVASRYPQHDLAAQARQRSAALQQAK